MSFNLNKWLPIGMKIVLAIPQAISAVETLKSGFSGSDKRKAGVDATKTFVGLTEDILDKDVVNDPAVEAAVGEAIDALVKVQNVVKAVKAAKVPSTPQ